MSLAHKLLCEQGACEPAPAELLVCEQPLEARRDLGQALDFVAERRKAVGKRGFPGRACEIGGKSLHRPAVRLGLSSGVPACGKQLHRAAAGPAKLVLVELDPLPAEQGERDVDLHGLTRGDPCFELNQESALGGFLHCTRNMPDMSRAWHRTW